MNDRFRCRGCITITYTDTEKDEDKEVKIIIEPEALYCNDDQSIGISYERLEKVIDSLKLEEKEKDYIWNALYDMELDYHWYNFSPDYVEQCTGLKDKNGELIYENDIIDTPNGIYRVAVDDFGLWTAIYKGNPLKDVVEWGDIVKNYAFNKENVEIVILGNIHQDKELLDE